MNQHQGHRQRMRQRFLTHGLENFDDHSALELLLFYAVPRVNTNGLAHRLLDEFGSLSAVFEAGVEELMRVEGIGENAAALIRLIPAMSGRYQADKNSIGRILASVEDAGRFVLPYFLGHRDERVVLLCLDAKMKLIDCRPIASGDVTTAHVSVRKVAEQAMRFNAPFVILAHNHVGGLALPSEEDVRSTEKMRLALAQLGISLLDHLVVAGDDYVSMQDSGLMGKKEE